MKIITWNINGYRAVAGQNPSKRYDTTIKENKLFAFVNIQSPDILCLQEIKASEEQIDENLRNIPDYEHFFLDCKTKKGYSGVACFTKCKPNEVRYGIGNEKFDNEGRIIEMRFNGFTLLNIYFPKGYADNDRLDFKLEFYDTLFDYIENIRKNQPNIIISGDYNTAHHEIDLARPKENIGTSGFMPIEREKLDKLILMGFSDAFRLHNKDGGHYSWWSQRGRARENNIGWRIDYHFVSNELAGKVANSYMLPDQTGSDHCPVVLEIDL